MISLPLTVMALLALATAAPTTPAADPPTTLAPITDETSAVDHHEGGHGGNGGGNPYELSLEEDSEEDVPEGELGLGEDMEGAENIVFRPLFRYRERASSRRRIRNSNRRRDTNYRRTYAARFPHYRYRPTQKRRTASYNHHQILY